MRHFLLIFRHCDTGATAAEVSTFIFPFSRKCIRHSALKPLRKITSRTRNRKKTTLKKAIEALFKEASMTWCGDKWAR